MGRGKTYLSMREPAEAWALLASRIRSRFAEETIPVEHAGGRVTSRPCFARISSPAYHGAAMDGFAVRARQTLGASPAAPVRLARGADALPIDTGDALPAGYDAVVMIEHVHEPSPDSIEIASAVPPWRHVRLLGEDVVAG